MKRFLLVILAALALGTSACASPGITPADAKALVQKGAALVDVRSPEEFASGHIEGAVNIPIDQLDARKGELKKDADIVLYCRSGARSERGRVLLSGAGYTKVYNLGAMSNWK
ncbi:MAG: rhodanese-like domain-containing protein [Myxococcus sp.]|nr:rhodanese-like domain-containing protein [Myxococcus sp.]